MVSGLLNDLSLYRRLIGMQLRSQAQYRANLVIDISTYFFITFAEFFGVIIVFASFPSLLGWHLGDVAMLYAVTSMAFGLSELVGAGIDNFVETIRRGEFDRVLLRPVGAFIQVIGSDFRLRRLGRLTEGLLTFFVALHFLPALQWTLAKAVALLIGIASGGVIFISVLLLGATMCFWTVETTEMVNIFTYGGREMLSYPITIYNRLMQSIFMFVIPLAFGSFVPVCYVLGRSLPLGLPSWLAFLAPLIALAFALVSGLFWRFGVRHYQSSGS